MSPLDLGILAIFQLVLTIISLINTLVNESHIAVPITYGASTVALLTPLLLVFLPLFIKNGISSTKLLVFPRACSLLISVFMAYMVISYTRLGLTSEYGGSFNDLDFGSDCDGDSNVALDSLHSIWHVGFGALLTFTFPVWYLMLPQLIPAVLAAASVGYPVYFIIAQLHSNIDCLDTSEVPRLGLEWVIGGLIGVAIGTIITAIASLSDRSNGSNGSNGSNDRTVRLKVIPQIVVGLAGLVLMTVVFAVSLIFTAHKTTNVIGLLLGYLALLIYLVDHNRILRKIIGSDDDREDDIEWDGGILGL
jgi:hypothetical protein